MPPLARPAEVKTDADRQQMLYWLIRTQYNKVTSAAKVAGMNRVHLTKILNGKNHFLELETATIERLLNLFAMPDEVAWETFNIPEAYRAAWTTRRPPPLGYVKRPEGVHEVVLKAPLQLLVPAGYAITVDENAPTHGLIVSQVGDDLYVTPAGAIPANGKVLGQLIGVDTAYRREL